MTINMMTHSLYAEPIALDDVPVLTPDRFRHEVIDPSVDRYVAAPYRVAGVPCAAVAAARQVGVARRHRLPADATAEDA